MLPDVSKGGCYVSRLQEPETLSKTRKIAFLNNYKPVFCFNVIFLPVMNIFLAFWTLQW